MTNSFDYEHDLIVLVYLSDALYVKMDENGPEREFWLFRDKLLAEKLYLDCLLSTIASTAIPGKIKGRT